MVDGLTEAVFPRNTNTTKLIDNLLEETRLILQPELPAPTRIRLTNIVDEYGTARLIPRFSNPEPVVESFLALAKVVEFQGNVLRGDVF